MPNLLLTRDFPPAVGGMARFMGELARRYPPGSLVVSTADAPGGAAADAGLPSAVDRIRIPAARLRTVGGLLLWSRRATALARQVQPDFVWCGQLRPAAYPARWLNERLGIPYGILVYGSDLLGLQHRLHQSRVRRSTMRTILGSAAVIVAVSRWTRDLCRVVMGELGLSPAEEDIRVVPLGADPKLFRPGIDTAAVRARYGLQEGRWLFTVARLVPHKGVDTTFHAMVGLAREFPDLRYAVVGQGGYQPVLEALARDLGIADRVRILNDVPDDDLPALYNVADLYVGVSRQVGLAVEGFAITLLEASACGLPVIAGRSGGIPDAIRDGDTGLLVDAEDPMAVASAVGALLRDPARARSLGDAARAVVEVYYNWDRVVGDLQQLSRESRVEGRER